MVISDRTARRYVAYVPTMISVIMSTAPVPRAAPQGGRGQTARRVSNLLVPLDREWVEWGWSISS